MPFLRGGRATSCRFPARPTCPTGCCARSTRRPSITAARSSPRSATRCSTACSASSRPRGPVVDLSGVGHRRLGGGARQHAVARRPRAHVRDRPFRDAVARDGRAARPRRRVRARRLAPRRRPGGASKRGWRTTRRIAIKAVLRRAQRDLDRRHQPHRRDPRGDRPRRASGAADGRHDLVARRRSTTGTTNGASTSRSAGSQKGLMLPPGLGFNAISAQGARGPRQRRPAARRTGTGQRDAAGQRRPASSRTRRRPTCSTGCARRCAMLHEEGLRQRLRAPRAPRRGDPRARSAPGGSRSCAPTTARVLARAHRGA